MLDWTDSITGCATTVHTRPPASPMQRTAATADTRSVRRFTLTKTMTSRPMGRPSSAVFDPAYSIAISSTMQPPARSTQCFGYPDARTTNSEIMK